MVTKKYAVASALIATLVILTVITCHPPNAPEKSLAIQPGPVYLGKNGISTSAMTISNMTDYLVWYYLLFRVESKSNGFWESHEIAMGMTVTGGQGPYFLGPHECQTNLVYVPTEATEFKIGIDMTSVTWRSRLAVRLAGGGLDPLPLGKLIHFLVDLDEKKRSKTEWSESVTVVKEKLQ